ncbi:MAG: hypothetical protein IKD45_05935 [Clostridia bacterium]|nr:hypothetical protein [Clostridia bacterium]
MIYIKIYLDKDEGGEDMLVFDSAKEDSGDDFFTVAGSKTGYDNYPYYQNMTTVIGVEQVAISPEAKAFLISLLNDGGVCEETHIFRKCDITLLGCCKSQHGGWDSGTFAFAPEDARNGITSRKLRKGEHFLASFTSTEPLEYMTPCENEMLKGLDITEPIDETVPLDAYYGAMRARGEEPACDEDTIRKTPLRYLTEAQKEVIRAEYKKMINRYDSQEWHYNGDFLDDKIKGELIEKYHKLPL